MDAGRAGTTSTLPGVTLSTTSCGDDAGGVPPVSMAQAVRTAASTTTIEALRVTKAASALPPGGARAPDDVALRVDTDARRGLSGGVCRAMVVPGATQERPEAPYEITMEPYEVSTSTRP